MTDPNIGNPYWCQADNCPAHICGGPHYIIETDLGTETVKVGQSPLGVPVDEQPINLTPEQVQAGQTAVSMVQLAAQIKNPKNEPITFTLGQDLLPHAHLITQVFAESGWETQITLQARPSST